MARLVFGMNQSLDGYVDHLAFGPSPTLFRHFIEEAKGQAGTVLPSLDWSMSIASTCTLSCLGMAHRILPDRGRRCAWWPMTGSARTCSG